MLKIISKVEKIQRTKRQRPGIYREQWEHRTGKTVTWTILKVKDETIYAMR